MSTVSFNTESKKMAALFAATLSDTFKSLDRATVTDYSTSENYGNRSERVVIKVGEQTVEAVIRTPIKN